MPMGKGLPHGHFQGLESHQHFHHLPLQAPAVASLFNQFLNQGVDLECQDQTDVHLVAVTLDQGLKSGLLQTGLLYPVLLLNGTQPINVAASLMDQLSQDSHQQLLPFAVGPTSHTLGQHGEEQQCQEAQNRHTHLQWQDKQ